ncbi:MAG: TauD/TfdA dioxygenase family protein [Burkholderiales bacterium]
MHVTANPLHPVFAAELIGVDLADRLSQGEVAAVLDAMDRYAVCVVHHDRPLTDAQHVAASAQFGPMQRSQVLKVSGVKPRLAYGEIIDQSNLDDAGNLYGEGDRRLLYKRANRLWHTDMSFHPVRATYSLLSAHVIPPTGADTEFTDLRAAYDALPNTMKARIDTLSAEHSYWYSRTLAGGPPASEEEQQSRPPACHRLVHTHPRSGRKSLYLASHASHILGLPVDEGRALIAELTAFATQPQFVFAHKWRVGDVLIWDNLCTMHRATEFDDTTIRRDVRRTTCREAEVD